MAAIRPEETNSRPAASPVAAISREIVRIYARYYGRGPTKAKAVWRHDLVVVVLEEIFTKAEEVLINGGRFEQVRANRRPFRTRSNRCFATSSKRRPRARSAPSSAR